MNCSDIASSLRRLDRMLSRLRVLEDGSSQVLQDAARRVEESYKRFHERSQQTHHKGAGQLDWGFEISPEHPLRFVRAEHVEGHMPEVDLYGMMRWGSRDGYPEESSFVLRVWSSSAAFFYREEWDAERFCECLTSSANAQGVVSPRRVLLRLRFDLRKRDALHEPLYHLQIGGQAKPDELCWLPNIANPRIPFVPVDLLLACEIVVADFFSCRYLELTNEPEYRWLLGKTHTWLLRPYLEDCLSAMNDGKSWVQHAHTPQYRSPR